MRIHQYRPFLVFKTPTNIHIIDNVFVRIFGRTFTAWRCVHCAHQVLLEESNIQRLPRSMAQCSSDQAPKVSWLQRFLQPYFDCCEKDRSLWNVKYCEEGDKHVHTKSYSGEEELIANTKEGEALAREIQAGREEG